MSQPSVETAELWQAPSLTAARRAAWRDAWAAFWTSRAVVWGAGMAAILIFGWASDSSSRLDPLFTTLPFRDDFLNLVVAPGARFDSAWYLAIADHGYEVSGRAAFFPLFPALVRLGGELTGSTLAAGMAISFGCSLGGLYLLHRLVALDFGLAHARTVVWLAAWFPGAMVLSALYSESVFLLVSVGALYAARLGRWPLAGSLGALAGMGRSGGILIAVPLLILYLYGPRTDGPRLSPRGWLCTRYPIRADLLWVMLAPAAGLAAYVAYLGISTGDPAAFLSAQADWDRTFIPLGGIALGAWSVIQSVVDLFPGPGRPAGIVPSFALDLRDIVLFGFLVGGIWLINVGSRRLNPAYTAYAVSGLALPLSVPAAGFPLMSLPRFEVVLFPLFIALALWAGERRRVRQVLFLFGTLLAVSSGLFALWVMAP